jgi:hypothetical protein
MSQKRSLSFFNRKKEQLVVKPSAASTDLAMKIIEKEIELEKSWDPKVIHELMNLYSKIIEQYEQNNNPKYLDFQDRMHKMLVRPQVISALQRLNCSRRPSDSTGETSKSSKDLKHSKSLKDPKLEMPETQSKTEDSSQPSMSAEAKPKLSIDKILLNPSKSSNALAARKAQAEQTRKTLAEKLTKNLSKVKSFRNVECIIERQSSTSRETAHKAVADFKSQESGLERRKASRKLSAMARSMTLNSSNDFSRSSRCDISGTTEENNSSAKISNLFEDHSVENFDNFEKRLESIMEKNYTERAMKIAEIKIKYENQMEEIRGTGDIMDLVVRQMKVNMQEEIQKVTTEFDARRKEEIRKLREFSG